MDSEKSNALPAYAEAAEWIHAERVKVGLESE